MKVRNFLRMTRKKLAIHLGNNPRTIENWEKGESFPNADHLFKIYELNNRININWIVTGEGEMLLDENYKGGQLNEPPSADYLIEEYSPLDLHQNLVKKVQELENRLVYVEKKIT